MRKFIKPSYNEINEKKVNDYESTFSVGPLERGVANTIGNSLRRVLLSSISGVAPFAVKIANAQHEFQTLTGVSEDVVQLILNLKKVRFYYNHDVFKDGEVIKVSLKNKNTEITAAEFTLPAGVEIVNTDQYIATGSKEGSLNLELFITSGRGFTSFEDNKEFIKTVSGKITSKIQTGTLIATDSDFSPIKQVAFQTVEINTASQLVEEKLELNIKTDESVEAKDALAEASHILMAHLSIIGNVENLQEEEIFAAAIKKQEKDKEPTPIEQLELTVRSSNSLKRAGYNTLEDLATLTRKELSDIKNLGKKSEDEILEKLAQHGFKLEGDE